MREDGSPHQEPIPEPSSLPATDSARVEQALEEYAAIQEAGRQPDRDQFLRRHNDIAPVLAECLDALQLVHDMAAEIRPETPIRSSSPLDVGDKGGTLAPGFVLDDYRIVREIGRGGMGVVYEALQLSLERRIALKALPFAATLDERQLQRFRIEAHAAASLHHPNIVPVHGIGCDRGVHFYVMQFIEGHPLSDLVRGLRRLSETVPGFRASPFTPEQPSNASPGPTATRLPACGPSYCRAIAGLGLQAAEALDHAHQLGVVHRDIKPGNLLVEPDGRLWITDFGLAQVSTEQGLTGTCDVVGTLRYMSPEQARALPYPVDHRTDIFSLGVTLYELLTLRHAFYGEDRQELLRQIAGEEPVSPRRRNGAIAVDLESIVLKAMAKEPAERYGSTRELAEDLRSFLQDRPVLARRPTALQRLRKWTLRHKTIVSTTGAVCALALLLLAIGAWWHTEALSRSLEQTKQREREAQDRKQEAQEQRRQAVAHLYQSLVGEARALQRARDIGYCPKVWDRLRQALELDTPKNDMNVLRQEAVACLGDFVGLEPITWTDLSTPLGAIAFHPDGKLLAVIQGDGTICVRDASCGNDPGRIETHSHPVLLSPNTHVRDGDDRARIDTHSTVGDLAFAPNEALLAVDRGTGGVDGWERGDNHVWKHARSFRAARCPGGSAMTLTSYGQHLLACCEGGACISLWDTGTGTRIGRLSKDGPAGLSAPAWGRNGQLLAAVVGASFANQVVVWDVPSRQIKRVIKSPLGSVLRLAFSPDGSWMACACNEGMLVLDTNEYRQQALLRLDSVLAVGFSPDGRFLAFRTGTGMLHVWSAYTNREVAALRLPSGWPCSVSFSPDGKILATADPRTIHLWRFAGSEEKLILAGHSRGVTAVDFCPDRKLLASGGKDGLVILWDVDRGQKRRVLPRFENAVQSVAFSPNGHLLAVGDFAGHLRIWDVVSDRLAISLRHTLGMQIHAVAFSPDGRYLAASGNGLTIWQINCRDTEPGAKHETDFQQIVHLPGRASWYLRISPDSKLLAWVDQGNTICLWDLQTGRDLPFAAPPLLNGWHNLAFYPDSRHLTFVTQSGIAEVWNVHGGRATMLGPAGAFQSFHVAASRDGRWFAADRSPSAIALWNGHSENGLFSLPEETSPIWSLAWDQDADRLALGLSDGGVVVWNLNQVRAQVRSLGLDWEDSPEGPTNPPQPYRPASPAEREHMAIASLHRSERLQSLRQFPEAEQVGKEAQEILAQLSAASPTKPHYQARLAQSQLALAYLYQRTQRNDLAEKTCRESETLCAKLVDRFRSVPDHRQNLAEARSLLAELYHTAGRLEEAERAYWEVEQEYAKLAADFSTQPSYRDGWSHYAIRLGEFLQANGRLSEAEQSYRTAVTVSERLVEEFPRTTVYREKLASRRLQLAGLLLAQGRGAETVAMCRKAIEGEGIPATTLYRAACLCAGASRQTASAEKLDAGERKRLAVAYAEQAVDLLRRAISGGFRNIKDLRDNPALAPLRGRQDFQDLVRSLETKQRAERH